MLQQNFLGFLVCKMTELTSNVKKTGLFHVVTLLYFSDGRDYARSSSSILHILSDVD